MFVITRSSLVILYGSAYASGALVKCRKVGAKNWGNKSKTKEEVQYLNTEDYQRIQEYGNVYTIIVLWRGKSHRATFLPGYGKTFP